MDKDKFQELFEEKALADQQLEMMRTPVTILFSDIKDSTPYFEKYGDIAGMSMVERHNDLLFPVITENGGRVVKTIGDAIMASFQDGVGGVRAAVGMQRALAGDWQGRTNEEQIHIKIGVHTGLGLLKDNDIFGDVVNTAARVQQQAKADQILITEALLDAAKASGFQCANFGKAEMKGKDEPIDVYVVAWSDSAADQLIEELQTRFDLRLKSIKRQHDDLEEEYESARNQWRSERRKLGAQIEELEEAVENAQISAQAQVSDELQSEVRFQLEESIRAREDLQQHFDAARAKWESERNGLKTQIAAMQGTVIEALERSNNPTRMALAVREQVDARLVTAKQEWQLQFEGERRRLTAEIERLKNPGSGGDVKKEAARHALLEKLGKLPAGSTGPKNSDQWQREFEDAKVKWETERDHATLKIRQLENDLQHTRDTLRSDAHQELRGQYEAKLEEANRERHRLEMELQTVSSELKGERDRLTARVAELEQAIPEAQASARKQLSAELGQKFDSSLDEANRLRARAERKLQDVTEELEAERRRSKRQMADLEEQLKEAKEAAYKAQRPKP